MIIFFPLGSQLQHSGHLLLVSFVYVPSNALVGSPVSCLQQCHGLLVLPQSRAALGLLVPILALLYIMTIKSFLPLMLMSHLFASAILELEAWSPSLEDSLVIS